MLRSLSLFSISSDRKLMLGLFRKEKKKPRPLSRLYLTLNFNLSKDEKTPSLEKLSENKENSVPLTKFKSRAVLGKPLSSANPAPIAPNISDANGPALRTRQSLPLLNKNRRHTVLYALGLHLNLPLGQLNHKPMIDIASDDTRSLYSDLHEEHFVTSPLLPYTPETVYSGGEDSLDTLLILYDDEPRDTKSHQRLSDINLIMKFMEQTSPGFDKCTRFLMEGEENEYSLIKRSLQASMEKEEASYRSIVKIIGSAVMIGVELDREIDNAILTEDLLRDAFLEPYEDTNENFYLTI